ncbi:proton channel OtopLc [Stomoxys calcitrans]|uniref:proton channel OtopLc n=1 Tax=Stomoxys calcitrans TaxID=35570 RepID=UPI0027E3280D|nr:proton channel OtopLc [Stomoxys calcitrans]
MDSSPDLSLKLRRGSSDSRDNFYMDFAQGIDSDIEEVDNTALEQATAPPLPLVGDGMDYMVIPPPPPSVMSVMQQQPMGLPTVSEHEDMPPTPPPQMTVLPSPPASPTTSVLEMMPPPPMSPPPSMNANRVLPQPPSPPLETEDEDDDDDDEDEVNETDDNENVAESTPDEEAEETDDKETDDKESEAEDQDDDNDGDDEGDKDSPPPPLPPIPSHLAYGRNQAQQPSPPDDEDDSHLPQPMQGQTPSTSPSPPVTPPPCPALSSIQKIVSPPPTHVSQIPPLTPPSDSDQSQPNSPPPISKHSPLTMPSTPPPPPECDVVDDEQPPTPPPEFGQQDEEEDEENPEEEQEEEEEENPEEEPEIDLSGVTDEPSLDLVQEVLHEAAQKALNGEENKSSRDDDSTTITTPPTNGYSASSMYNHQQEEEDAEHLMASIPPPAGLEDTHEDEEDGTKTPVSETKPLDLDELSSDRMPPPPLGREASAEEDAEKRSSLPGTPTSQVSQISQATPTPTVSGSPKRKSSVTSGGGSRVPSRSVSRSGSRSGGSRTASRQGSIRGGASGGSGSVSSRAGSIAAASVASAAASIVSASQSIKAEGIISPPLSLKSESRHIRAASSSGDETLRHITSHTTTTSTTTPVTVAPTPNLLVSPESVSHTSSVSPAKLSARIRESGSQHRVTIDESNLPVASQLTCGGGGDGDGDGSGPPSPGTSSQQQLTGDERQTGHLALMYHSSQLTSYPVLPAIKRTHRPSFVYPPMPRVKKSDALATLFSALYGKLLVVMGIAFPMAEVISTYIPPSFYEVYYLYLYIGSMIFLLFMYATLLWGRPKIPANIASPTKLSAKTRSTSASESMDESDTDSTSTHRNKRLPPALSSARRPSLLSPLGRQHHYGSFYLRMGAVAFGIGSMIYSGLEFGQYFELNPDTKCHNVLLALTPATRMAFIFIQMYFIFLNNEQIKVYRYKIIARFGLMHMIGTNLAVWLNVLIQETKHEILTFYNPENRTLRISHRIPGHSRAHSVLAPADPNVLLRVPRGLKGPYQIFECRRTNILGTLVQDASPFLFPCTIEYSLICAAILYVMWKSISRPQAPKPQRPDMISSPIKRSPHHYSVDCARAHKGLFVGILILVLTIISLILFFVLISRPDFVALAVMEVTICELFIYGTATIATLVGMFQIRHLQYDAYRSFSLDDILLVGAQTGSFLYNIFTVIAGHFSLRSDDWLVPLNALASIVQTACQTMFILDASRRQAVTPEHMRKKPGREVVTFMLVVNLAMWAISTLEKSRAESHPIQLNFYGLWAWTIITHVSMPLAIFYRFHSTVCLCEIWKRAYKLKPTYM